MGGLEADFADRYQSADDLKNDVDRLSLSTTAGAKSAIGYSRVVSELSSLASASCSR